MAGVRGQWLMVRSICTHQKCLLWLLLLYLDSSLAPESFVVVSHTEMVYFMRQTTKRVLDEVDLPTTPNQKKLGQYGKRK